MSVVWFAITFSHSEGCLFTLFIVSFAIQKHLSWRNIPRFLGWKNQFCENDYTTRSNLYIQWDPYQITKTFFTELEQQQKKNFPICSGNTKDSSQNSMALTQKQKYRSMKQDRKSRDKPIHLSAPYLWQRRQKYTMEQRKSLQ